MSLYTPPMPMTEETPAERDQRLLQAWRSAFGYQKDQAASALLTSLGGPIGTAVNSYRGAPVPQVTLELEGKRLALEACQNYDGTKGMSLASYVITMVKQRLYRYVAANQNVARLPEAQVQQIGALREANTDLTARFGREPTVDELADHMGIPVKHVTRLRTSLRSDLMEAGTGMDNIEAFESDPNYEKAMMAYYSMTPLEKQVFDYSLGAHGQPRLKAGEIAQRLGVSAPRISALKQNVAQKIQPYMGSTSSPQDDDD